MTVLSVLLRLACCRLKSGPVPRCNGAVAVCLGSSAAFSRQGRADSAALQVCKARLPRMTELQYLWSQYAWLGRAIVISAKIQAGGFTSCVMVSATYGLNGLLRWRARLAASVASVKIKLHSARFVCGG